VISTSFVDNGATPRAMFGNVVSAVFVGYTEVKFVARGASPGGETFATSSGAGSAQRTIFVGGTGVTE